MKKLLIVSLLIALVAGFAFANGEGESADAATKWPQKPINIVVAFGAGGNSDVNARAIAKYLQKELGQPVVITNVSGSGGTLGANQVKEAAPDGYTILCSQLSMNVAKVVGLVDSNMQASCSRKDFPHSRARRQHSAMQGWHPRRPCGS